MAAACHTLYLLVFHFNFVDRFEFLTLSLEHPSLWAVHVTLALLRPVKMLVLLAFIIIFHITSAALLFIATIDNVSSLSF